MRLTLPMSDAELIAVSRANPGFQIERDPDGTLLVSPTHTNGGAKSAEAPGQLYTYAKRGGGFWQLSPDVAVEVRSPSDAFADVVAKVTAYVERGSRYAVAIDPDARAVVEAGSPPPGLDLDFDAIIDA